MSLGMKKLWIFNIQLCFAAPNDPDDTQWISQLCSVALKGSRSETFRNSRVQMLYHFILLKRFSKSEFDVDEVLELFSQRRCQCF